MGRFLWTLLIIALLILACPWLLIGATIILGAIAGFFSWIFESLGMICLGLSWGNILFVIVCLAFIIGGIIAIFN